MDGAREVIKIFEGRTEEFVGSAGEGSRRIHLVRCMAGEREGCMAEINIVGDLTTGQSCG